MLQISMFTTVETSHEVDEKMLRQEKPIARPGKQTYKQGAKTQENNNRDTVGENHTLKNTIGAKTQAVSSQSKPAAPENRQVKNDQSASSPLNANAAADLFPESGHNNSCSDTRQSTSTGSSPSVIPELEASTASAASAINILRFKNTLDDLTHILLPLLAYHSFNNEGRWVSWIGQRSLDKNLLLEYGVNLSSIRMLVNEQDASSLFKMTLAALSNGNSHLVVLLADSIDESFYEELECAALEGHSSVILLTAAAK